MSDNATPGDPTRRQFLFGGGMVATSAAAYALTPRTREAAIAPGQLEQVIPKRLGPWNFVTASGLVIPPPDETDQRSYDQVLTRVYSRPGDALPVMLLIAYGGGQSGLFIVHRPEACYPAQGYALSDPATMDLELMRGRRVLGTAWSAHSALRDEQLLYWTRIGNQFPRSWAAEHLAIASKNLVGRLPDGVLVRMSVPSSDRDAAMGTLKDFARVLVDRIGVVGRRVILGEGGG